MLAFYLNQICSEFRHDINAGMLSVNVIKQDIGNNYVV